MRHAGILFILLLSLSIAQASVIKVPTDQPTIQAGINAASDFDTVLVEPGIYAGTGNRDINFMGKKLMVIGEKGSDSTVLNLVGSGMDAFIMHDPYVEGEVTINGFKIIGAVVAIEGQPIRLTLSDLEISNCSRGVVPLEFSPGQFDQAGEILLQNSEFTNNGICISIVDGSITDCLFQNNDSVFYNGYYPWDSIFVTDCSFDNNGKVCNYGTFFKSHTKASENQETLNNALFFEGCTFQFNQEVFQGRMATNNCTISSNDRVYASVYAGHLVAMNSVFSNNTDTMFTLGNSNYLEFTSCDFEDNLSNIMTPPSCGESCFFEDGVYVDLSNCIIKSNVGGIVIDRISRFAMQNCLYIDNSKPIKVIDRSSVTRVSLANSTFLRNDSGAIDIGTGGSSFTNDTVMNLIICGNAEFGLRVDTTFQLQPPLIICNNVFQNDINYISFTDQTGINGNISVDPMFYDTINGNYGLSSHSSCAPTNNSCGVLIGAYGAISTPPSVPISLTPPQPDNKPVFTMLPTFDWSAAIDPDPFDTVRYKLEIAINPGFSFVNTIDSIAASQFTLTDSLEFSKHYWWRVTVFDTDGLSAQSTVKDFWTWTLGDVNHSHSVTVADLTYMVQFLFNSGQLISPLFVGDLNQSCTVTIADLVYLVQYLFNSGTAPKVGCAP